MHICIRVYIHRDLCKNSYKEKCFINSSTVYTNLPNTLKCFLKIFLNDEMIRA